MYNFGENLKRICEEKEMSQPQMAAEMGVTYAAVNQWINGKRIPKGKTAVKIAEKINVPITRLTGCFPCGEELEEIFKKAINKIEKHKERLDEAEHIPEELGGISHENEIGVLERWEDFLKETFFNIITFAVSTPYPGGYVYEEDERTANSAEREDTANNELWRIRKEMLSSMKDAGISDMRQYNLVESLSSHILPAVYKTMAYAVRTENESMDTIALLYKQLNAKGKEVAIERLQELAQLPSYTD